MPQEKYNALRIETEGRVAEEKLMTALKQSGIFSVCYAYRSRVKPEKKLLEKKYRKLEKKPLYEIYDITDVIGIRLITLFRDEMPGVFEKLAEIILHENTINPNPFKKYHIEEVIAYTTNQYDYIPSRIKEIFDSKDLEGKFESSVSKEGYSSIHIVTRLNDQVDGLPKSPYHIPVEIQIRTVFEDAWSEIDHKFGYVIREGKESGTPIANPDSVLKHLKILKKFADACAEYADAIHSEAVPIAAIDSANVVSVSVDGEIFEVLAELGIDAGKIENYKVARELRLDGQKQRDEGIATFSNTFLQAAELFRELVENQAADADEESSNSIFLYYVKMSEAVCLMSTNQKDKVQAALAIYQALDQVYHSYPLLKMRLAQAYGKLGSIENSIDNFKLASKSLEEFESAGNPFSPKLPRPDYEHMKRYLPRLHGYQLWKRYRLITDADEESVLRKYKLIVKAYKTTERALSVVSGVDIIKVHNNLLYYALEIVSVSRLMLPSEEMFIPNPNIHLDIILKEVDIRKCNDLELLDTLSKAFDYTSSEAEAEEVTDRILSIVFDQGRNDFFDRDIMFEVAQEAYAMKQKLAAKTIGK